MKRRLDRNARAMLRALVAGPVKVLCNVHQFNTLEGLRDRGLLTYERRDTEHETNARFALITPSGVRALGGAGKAGAL